MIEVLIVNQAEVPRLLPMKECVDVMARAFASLARGEADMPVRQILWMAEKPGALGLMPAHLGGLAALGLKAVTFFPRNEGTDLDSHQGAVLLFETGRGRLLAIIDATSITSVRTAAVSGLATRLLAKPDAVGPRARRLGRGGPHAPRGDARRCGSSRADPRREQDVRARAELRRPRIQAPRHLRHALQVGRGGRQAAPTSSARSRPRASRCSWASGSRPERHVNAVGSSVATARELDTRGRRAAPRLFVDHRESALEEAGDFLHRARRRRRGRRSHRGRARPARDRPGAGPPVRRPRSRSSSPWASRSRTSPRRSTSTRRRAGSGIGKFVEFGGGRHDAD